MQCHTRPRKVYWHELYPMLKRKLAKVAKSTQPFGLGRGTICFPNCSDLIKSLALISVQGTDWRSSWDWKSLKRWAMNAGVTFSEMSWSIKVWRSGIGSITEERALRIKFWIRESPQCRMAGMVAWMTVAVVVGKRRMVRVRGRGGEIWKGEVGWNV